MPFHRVGAIALVCFATDQLLPMAPTLPSDVRGAN